MSRKGDFGTPFNPFKSYGGVVQQQGRVALGGNTGSSAQWNPAQDYGGVVEQQGRVSLDSDAGSSPSPIFHIDLGPTAYYIPLGAISGTPKHPPVKITREADSASHLFWEAWITHKVLRKVTIHFSGPRGVPYTLQLADATITNITRISIPGAGGVAEQVEFSYGGKETTMGTHS